jgi:beta-lactamase class A
MKSKRILGILKKADGIWGIIVKRMASKEVLFEHNADLLFPAASVGKVSIALYVLHLADTGRIKLDRKLEIKKKHYASGSGVLQYFTSNTQLSVKDLGILMLTISDNTAAKVLVDTYGAKNINSYLRTLGFKKTKLGIRGHAFDFGTTTPKEMATMLEGIYLNKYLRPKSSQMLIEIMKRCQNDLALRRYLPRKGYGASITVQVAHKTGALDKVRNDVGIVFSKHPYVISVFAKNQKDISYGPQNKAVLTIAELSREAFRELK